jgi:hypothetical protein
MGCCKYTCKLNEAKWVKECANRSQVYTLLVSSLCANGSQLRVQIEQANKWVKECANRSQVHVQLEQAKWVVQMCKLGLKSLC